MGISLFLLFVLSGCLRKELVWTGTCGFQADTWKAEERLAFCPDTVFLEKDLATARAVISLRYADGASLEKLAVAMETENPATGEYTTDTIRLRLLPASERTASRARLGVFEAADTVSLKGRPMPGWNATLIPLEDISGVYSLTFEIINQSK